MSRAFVKEVEQEIDELPDRPVSPHPNLVTAEGLAAIERALSRGDGHRFDTREYQLMAQSGHHNRADPCPLLGVKRTSCGPPAMCMRSRD
jgi:hypothetical protein